MKILAKVALVALLFGSAIFVLASDVDAGDGWFKSLHKKTNGPPVTTPTRAFVQRQCDAVKRGLANIPGVRQMIATHQANHP
jgi:hypothetical protein